MRCSKVRTLLDDHVDGLLPADRAARVRDHLDACPDCDDETELLRAVTAPLSTWGDLEPPPDCFDRIVDRIASLPAHVRAPAARRAAPTLRVLHGGTRWLVTSGAVAAAVLVAAANLTSRSDFTTRTSRDSAPRVVSGSVGGLPATRAGLKAGELPLTRLTLTLTDDLEQRDGLRRRRPQDRDAVPPDLLVPVSADPLGAGSR